MAQLERYPRHVNTSKSLTTPTVEQLLRGGEVHKGSPTSSSASSPTSPYPEEDNGHHQKKSVLTKVKEKAKKLRHSLSKKKHEDGNVTPTWGVSLEDEEEEEEDAEYLGAPMYESELAPEGYKENARQHPRATPVIAENHVLQRNVKPGVELDREKPLNPIPTQLTRTTPKAAATTNPPVASNKIMTGTVADKLTPAYTKRSDAALSVSSKIQGLAVSKAAEHQTPPKASLAFAAPQTPPANMVSDAPKTPRFSSAPGTPRNSFSSSAAPLTAKCTNPSDQIWDKGVSVKEYFINKLEPGEDEKALSQVISDAINPKRTPGDAGVMEKVREAVTSLLRNDEPSQYAVKTPTRRTSSQIPVSSNVQEVAQEENHGRVLQTN